MGQIADDMVNGLCCELCSRYFIDDDGDLYEHGYPVVCNDCWQNLTYADKKHHEHSLYETV